MSKEISRANRNVPILPPRILLDIHTNCNLQCPQCLVHGESKDPRTLIYKNKIMPLHMAMSIIDEIEEIHPLLIPDMWSEPLLYPYFRELTQYMKKKGVTLAINTNGLLLSEEMAKFLVEIEFDSVIISIDATTDETLKKIRGFSRLSHLIKIVERLIKIRGSKDKPRIGVSMTLQNANIQERDLFVSYWTQRVDFVRIGTYFDGTEFIQVNIGKKGGRIPCLSLYSTMPIHADGNVSICCLDIFNEYNMGNVFNEGIKGVWNGEKFTRIRELHEKNDYSQLPLCRNCSRWNSYQYTDRIENGLLIRKSSEYEYYNRIDRLDSWDEKLHGTHTEWIDIV